MRDIFDGDVPNFSLTYCLCETFEESSLRYFTSIISDKRTMCHPKCRSNVSAKLYAAPNPIEANQLHSITSFFHNPQQIFRTTAILFHTFLEQQFHQQHQKIPLRRKTPQKWQTLSPRKWWLSVEVVTPWVNGPLPRRYLWMQESRFVAKCDFLCVKKNRC